MTAPPGEAKDGPSFEIPAAVLYQEVDGQMVLLDLKTERYFGLNEVGAAIVSRLTQQPFPDALATLVDDYDVNPERLRDDVDGLVAALCEAGLLKRVG